MHSRSGHGGGRKTDTPHHLSLSLSFLLSVSVPLSPNIHSPDDMIPSLLHAHADTVISIHRSPRPAALPTPSFPRLARWSRHRARDKGPTGPSPLLHGPSWSCPQRTKRSSDPWHRLQRRRPAPAAGIALRRAHCGLHEPKRFVQGSLTPQFPPTVIAGLVLRRAPPEAAAARRSSFYPP